MKWLKRIIRRRELLKEHSRIISNLHYSKINGFATANGERRLIEIERELEEIKRS